MPPELNRMLRTIKELDLKSEDLGAQIQENCDALMRLPTTKGSADDVETLRERIKTDQALLIQWAEEKVQLALQGHELLDMYMSNLETDVAALQQELQDAGILDDVYAMEDSYPMETEPQTVRRGNSRLHYASLDLEPAVSLPATAPPSRKASLSRQQSDYGSEAGYGTGNEAMAWEATVAPKTQTRQRRGGDEYGTGSRRRAASAAVHKTTAAVAALEEDDTFGTGRIDAPTASVAGTGAIAELGSIPAVAGVLMMEPFVPGLDHSAKEPQAPGQALTETDISPSLVGRVAEVFWPDEGNPEGSLWYLVKIESVDMIQKTASIRYQNGEMEEALSLVEVARDGHMRLLTI
jgi:hypothetical protein